MANPPHRVKPGEKIALKAEADKAESHIHFRCARQDKALWVREANKRGMKLTEFIMQAIREFINS